MSSYHQIFIRTDNSTERLIADLSVAANCEIRKLGPEYDPIAYAGERDNLAVEVELHHDFVDDLGISFSQYPVIITMRSYASDKSHEEVVAREIFNNLASMEEYKMILTFDLYTLLAQYPPDGG